MKRILIALTEELHTRVKMQATKEKMTLKAFVTRTLDKEVKE